MTRIPVQNIYYLLCYAWNKLEESKVVDVNAEDITKLSDLFAKVLITGTTYLLKKGLDRDYRSREETGRRIKGKILLASSVKQNLFQKSMARCEYDELNYDVLHNQIIKSTIGTLLKIKELNQDLRRSLITLYRRFPRISDIPMTTQKFRQVRLHRNNCFYDFLLKVCEIINEAVLIDERTGDYKFKDFLRDEKAMSDLFEAFVRNFYKKEQDAYSVSSEWINWYLEKAGGDDLFLPGMLTDISLAAKDGSRKIIIDTKYYRDGFKKKAKMGAGEKLISGNLYQMFAYLKNLERLGAINARCEGILLYAQAGEEADFHFSLPGHHLRVKTLNLNQDWRGIHQDLLALI